MLLALNDNTALKLKKLKCPVQLQVQKQVAYRKNTICHSCTGESEVRGVSDD